MSSDPIGAGLLSAVPGAGVGVGAGVEVGSGVVVAADVFVGGEDVDNGTVLATPRDVGDFGRWPSCKARPTMSRITMAPNMRQETRPFRCET